MFACLGAVESSRKVVTCAVLACTALALSCWSFASGTLAASVMTVGELQAKISAKTRALSMLYFRWNYALSTVKTS